MQINQLNTNPQSLLTLPQNHPQNWRPQLPSLDSSVLFQKHLFPKLQQIPRQSQIQQFIPFDPTIIHILDEQQLCTYDMLADVVVPYDCFLLGDEYLGGWENEVQRVTKVVRRLCEKGESEMEWYVRVFVRVENGGEQSKEQSRTTVYKNYRVEIKRLNETTNFGISECPDSSLPFDISIRHPDVGLSTLSAIILQPHHVNSQQFVLHLEVGTKGKDTKIYSILPTANQPEQVTICCDSIDLMMRQLVLMDEQLATFYEAKKDLISQHATYNVDGTSLQFSYKLQVSSEGKKSQSIIGQHHILQLSLILAHFHQNNLTLSNLAYQLMPFPIFTNFTQAECVQSPKEVVSQHPPEEAVYDILSLIGIMLDQGYAGPYRKSLQDILHLVIDGREVLHRWDQIILAIRSAEEQKQVGCD